MQDVWGPHPGRFGNCVEVKIDDIKSQSIWRLLCQVKHFERQNTSSIIKSYFIIVNELGLYYWEYEISDIIIMPGR